jgi:hypothetical protein
MFLPHLFRFFEFLNVNSQECSIIKGYFSMFLASRLGDDDDEVNVSGRSSTDHRRSFVVNFP